jgi:hypothetical protein
MEMANLKQIRCKECKYGKYESYDSIYCNKKMCGGYNPSELWNCVQFKAKEAKEPDKVRCRECKHVSNIYYSEEHEHDHNECKYSYTLDTDKLRNCREWEAKEPEKRCIDCAYATCKPNGGCNHRNHVNAGKPCKDYEFSKVSKRNKSGCESGNCSRIYHNEPCSKAHFYVNIKTCKYCNITSDWGLWGNDHSTTETCEKCWDKMYMEEPEPSPEPAPDQHCNTCRWNSNFNDYVLCMDNPRCPNFGTWNGYTSECNSCNGYKLYSNKACGFCAHLTDRVYNGLSYRCNKRSGGYTKDFVNKSCKEFQNRDRADPPLPEPKETCETCVGWTIDEKCLWAKESSKKCIEKGHHHSKKEVRCRFCTFYKKKGNVCEKGKIYPTDIWKWIECHEFIQQKHPGARKPLDLEGGTCSGCKHLSLRYGKRYRNYDICYAKDPNYYECKKHDFTGKSKEGKKMFEKRCPDYREWEWSEIYKPNYIDRGRAYCKTERKICKYRFNQNSNFSGTCTVDSVGGTCRFKQKSKAEKKPDIAPWYDSSMYIRNNHTLGIADLCRERTGIGFHVEPNGNHVLNHVALSGGYEKHFKKLDKKLKKETEVSEVDNTTNEKKNKLGDLTLEEIQKKMESIKEKKQKRNEELTKKLYMDILGNNGFKKEFLQYLKEQFEFSNGDIKILKKIERTSCNTFLGRWKRLRWDRLNDLEYSERYYEIVEEIIPYQIPYKEYLEEKLKQKAIEELCRIAPNCDEVLRHMEEEKRAKQRKRICPECKGKLRKKAEYCQQCGHRVRGAL